ncbi:MAG: hypothetical protein WCW84_13605 [Sulfurimonas sp.]|jgi:dUTPase
MFKSINDGKLPKRATTYSAAFDVFANANMTILEEKARLVPLGIAIDHNNMFNHLKKWYGKSVDSEIFRDSFKKIHYFELHPRSSLRPKGLIVIPGIIDIDYEDELEMIINNPISGVDMSGNTEYKVSIGEKIGQIILKRHEGIMMPEEYTNDEKRVGGFGSTVR